MNETAPEPAASEPAPKSLLARGWLVLVVMVALAIIAVTSALVRNNDTQRLNQENRRLNQENVRLNGCVRDLIVTIDERSKFSGRLDAQDEKDRQATRDFWTGIVAASGDRPKGLAIYAKYQQSGAATEAERKRIVAERDAYQFPSLAECQ